MRNEVTPMNQNYGLIRRFQLEANYRGASLLIFAGAFVAGLAFVAGGVSIFPMGPRAAHMANHILLMNAVAPALARAALVFGIVRAQSWATGQVLAGAAAAQIALLWAWHAPSVFAFSSSHVVVHTIMPMLLLGASLTFWIAILGETGRKRWRGIFGLLVTGKLSCLLGVLLLFAPRVLYSHDVLILGQANLEQALSDQRLAGLLMLAACPICYVLTGVTIAAHWLRELEASATRPLYRTTSC